MTRHYKNPESPDFLKSKINNVQSFFKNTSSSLNNRPLIGWFCTYTPEELIIAGGFTPLRIMGSKKITKAESYFPINFCPYIKSIWDSLLSGMSHLKALVFTNSCDGMRRLYDTANTYLKDIPSYLLDVPRLQGKDSEVFFQYNLACMKRFIEDTAGTKISDKEIEKAADLVNKKRKLLEKFSLLFGKFPNFIHISTYYRIMELSMKSETKTFTGELDKYLKFIEESVANNTTVPEPDMKSIPGIMIIGNFITEERLWGMLSSMKLRVSCDDLCISSRYFINLVDIDQKPDILASLARRYLNKSPCMRMADLGLKLKEIENDIIKKHIEGIIFISLKFCDTVLYSFPLLKERLNQMGIPALYLEMEYNNFSEGQLKTRIQAFLEML
jgi:benzoyl-CoA reductase/2-hydroxyglutaryl-CoA dehydratase subunit BcrC/BadD/HgdB